MVSPCLGLRVSVLTRSLNDPREVQHIVFARLNANTLGWGVFELSYFPHETAHNGGRERLRISVKTMPFEKKKEEGAYHWSSDDVGVNVKRKCLAEVYAG